MTPAEYLQSRGFQFKARRSWLELKRCPFCHGGRHNDVGTFAVHAHDGNYKCQRGSCGADGSFRQLQEHFGDMTSFNIKPSSSFVAPQVKPEAVVQDEVEAYLQLRGFSRATWERRKVGCDQFGNIVLPYFDHHGEHCMNKFRRPRKTQEGERKAWRETGGKAVLWGMDLANPSDGPLIITFGEFDALACDEAGIANVVSVPSGDQDLTWIDLCWDWLQGFREVVLWPDADESGQKALHEVAARLGRFRIRVIEVEFKDANSMLHVLTAQIGKDAALKAMHDISASARWYATDDVIRVADIPDEEEIVEGCKSDIPELDRMTGGFRGGEVTVWGGDNGAGKTTGVLGVAVAEAVDQEEAVFVYSGEMRRTKIRDWVELMLAGDEFTSMFVSKHTGHVYYKVDADVKPLIREWYRDRLYLFDVMGGTNEDNLFDAAELAFSRYGCRKFVFDNLMMLTLDADEKSYLTRQAQFMRHCKDFAQSFDAHIHVIAHNRKPGDVNVPPTKASVEGTQKITNLVDNAGAWWRVPKSLRASTKGPFAEVDALLCWFKTRETGEEGDIRLVFQPSSKRFAQVDKADHLVKRYGWYDREQRSEAVGW